MKMQLSKMLFFLCFRPTIKFQGGSPVDPLFEPPAHPPFGSASQKLFYRHFSRKGFCRNPRGIFPTKVLGEFCGGFFGGLFRAFFLGKKIGGKNPPKNPRQNSNQNLGVSRPKSTLQGSGLDISASLLSGTFLGNFKPHLCCF